ncbi:hypothetical protein BCR32DRAFT_269369 [Anaeromyces robustus]|uniref:DUF4709 domain-containing protein n=1 Tax=Anaeromyces robustus TaxID=1754192 RepID=A0A1Y1X1A6_9FUNG|nr:hypothetical protein BCR32DRAFT_269369 [Anaeromyces robustus]|eukprot:ORX79591.1 hypothetical protein BCR32DRAFT_269369 [Anaeromyces robustus]
MSSIELINIDDNTISEDDINKTKTSSISTLSLYDLVDELTISCTCVHDANHVSRPTQTTSNEIIDLKNVTTIYKNLNKNLQTVYNVIKVGYNKKINDSVEELHQTILQQLIQIEKAYKHNINTIRQAYHSELTNFIAKYKNYKDETLKNEHDQQLRKIINEKNYYADETVRLKRIINDQNNKLFRLKYILVQKYPAKVKQLFSEKNTELNDILDPRDFQIESAMQHLQIDKMKKENEIRNLKKKLNKVKNDLTKKLEDETEYITVEKHKRIVKEVQEDYELSMSLLEKEKDKEINRLYSESKKLKSIYEAQLLSLRKLQNKTNYNQVLERQNKILELSKIFFPKITRQSSTISTISTSQININNSNISKINKSNSLLMEKKQDSSLLSNNDISSGNKSVRPFTSYFPSEYVRKKI